LENSSPGFLGPYRRPLHTPFKRQQYAFGGRTPGRGPNCPNFGFIRNMLLWQVQGFTARASLHPPVVLSAILWGPGQNGSAKTRLRATWDWRRMAESVATARKKTIFILGDRRGALFNTQGASVSFGLDSHPFPRYRPTPGGPRSFRQDHRQRLLGDCGFVHVPAGGLVGPCDFAVSEKVRGATNQPVWMLFQALFLDPELTHRPLGASYNLFKRIPSQGNERDPDQYLFWDNCTPPRVGTRWWVFYAFLFQALGVRGYTRPPLIYRVCRSFCGTSHVPRIVECLLIWFGFLAGFSYFLKEKNNLEDSNRSNEDFRLGFNPCS